MKPKGARLARPPLSSVSIPGGCKGIQILEYGFNKLNDQISFSFDSDLDPPSIGTMSPIPGLFLAPSTIEIIEKSPQGVSKNLTARVGTQSGHIINILSDPRFQAGYEYTVKIAKTIKDKNGFSLGEDKVFTIKL